MLVWIADNAGTVIVALALLGIVCGIVIKLVKNRKEGKSSCGCGCEHCAMSGTCHKQ